MICLLLFRPHDNWPAIISADQALTHWRAAQPTYARDNNPPLAQYWATVGDGGPVLCQWWAHIACRVSARSLKGAAAVGGRLRSAQVRADDHIRPGERV